MTINNVTARRAWLTGRFLLIGSVFLASIINGHAAESNAPTSAPLNPPTYFGINGVGFLHHPNKKAENDRRWQLMRELGVKWDRSDLWWSDLEKSPGKWNYDVGDRAMKAYRDHGVQMFPILDYGAAWLESRGPQNEKERADFGNYVSNVVSRYKGFASTWEVWNEPNILPFWRPQPDAALYAPLLRLTYDKVHAADPAARVVGFTMADLDHDFLERVLQIAGAKCFDAVSYHFYRIGQPEQRTLAEMAELKLTLERFGRKDVPIWITEMGVTSYLGTEGVSEDLQAIYLMRQVLLLIAGGAERIFPFCLVDNVTDPGGPWGSQLGLVTLDWRRKPAFFAYKTMIAELQDYRLVRDVDLGENVCAYLFETRDHATTTTPRHKLVAWTTTDVRDVRIDVDDIPTTRSQPGRVDALKPIPLELQNYSTHLGERRALEFDGATARVMVSPAPIYLPVRNAALVANASTTFRPAVRAANPGDEIHATLHGQPNGTVAISRTNSVADGWKPITSEEDPTSTEVHFTVPGDTKPGWYKVRATVAGTSGTVAKDLRLWVREPISVQVRPFATTATRNLVTSITLNNTGLHEALSYKFSSSPALPGIDFPSGMIGESAGKAWTGELPEKTNPYFQQAVVEIPRKVLSELNDTLLFRMNGRTVYRMGVLPILDKDPRIDSLLNDFSSVPRLLLNDSAQVLTGEWRSDKYDPEDASAAIAAAWGSDGLYLGCEISDDYPMMNDRGEGPDVYKGDGVEIYLCPAGYSGQYYANKQNGAYHFALSPGRDGKGALVSDFDKAVVDSKIAVRRTKTGYNIEAFIPKSAFGNYVAQRGNIIGWDVQLNDRDDYSDSAKQKALMWNGDHMNWLRAGKWGMALIK